MALDDLDRRMVGDRNKRVTIPMESRELLSVALDMLQGMCTEINIALCREGLSERQVLMLAAGAARAYQDQLQTECRVRGITIREGRPSNAERLRDTGMIRRVK